MNLKKKLISIIGVVIALILVALTTFNLYSANQLANEIVAQQMDMQLNNIEASVKAAKQVVGITQEALNQKHINLTRAIAEIIKKDPTQLETANMKALAKALEVDEIHVIDEKGIAAYGTVPDFFGFDLKTNEQTNVFIPLIEQNNGVLAQDITVRGIDQQLFQYIGVSRLDQKGIVQIGIAPKAIEKITSKMDVQRTLEQLQLGETGFALIADIKGIVLNHKDPNQIGLDLREQSFGTKILEQENILFEFEIGQEVFYGQTKQFDDKILFVALPTELVEKAQARITINSSFIGVGGFILLILLISFVITKSMIKPIRQVEEAMSRVGVGYFNEKLEIKSKDEIGALSQNFNIMTQNVQSLVKETNHSVNLIAEESVKISEAINSLSTTSSQVTDAVEDIAQGATDMAGKVGQRVEMGRELGKHIEDMMDMIRKAQGNTDNMSKSNDKGKSSIETLDNKFKQTVASTEEVDRKITELAENSKSIETIVEAIRSIADQTNLLALNASIEAARAGEHGKGFAVVADEIRKLAEESGQATEQINGIIKNIVTIVNSTNQTMEGARQTVVEVNEDLNQTKRVFEEINDNTGFVSNSMQDLAHGIDYIDVTKETLIQALESISALSQESAASTEEISASTEEQASRIHEITDSVDEFNKSIKILENEMQKFKL